MITTSPTFDQLATALVEFHKRIGHIKKDSDNPFFKSKYASLNNLLNNCIPILCDCGIAVVQVPEGINHLTTFLIHAKSGQFIQSTYAMEGSKKTPQEQGSLLSYMRRYSILSILNLNVSEGEDDDGNAATFGENKEIVINSLHELPKAENDDKPWLNIGSEQFNGAVAKMKEGKSSIQALRNYFKISKKTEAALKEAIA